MNSPGVVVVGGGQAGASTVLRLRANGYSGLVTLICGEPTPPYQRPPLSKKYLIGEYARERLYLRPESAYADLDVSLLKGRVVAEVDRAARTLRLEDGTRLDYETLILTTGSRAVPLPSRVTDAAYSNLLTFRTLADTAALQAELRPGRRMLVVGGGYIGLEMAAVARQFGLDITLIEQAPRILQRVAAAETAEVFRKLHRGEGVKIIEGCGLANVEGEGPRANLAVLSDGRRVPFDVAVIGIGARPETDLAEAAGLAVEDGIVVDGHGRTSDPSIFAAGDCTSFPYLGGRLRLESVQNAIAQAEHVADFVSGAAEDKYAPVPWFWSDQYDTKLQIAGLNTGYDQVITRDGSREGAQSIWYFRQGRFIAVDAINEPRVYMLGKRWLETGVAPDPGALADAKAELKLAA